MAEYGYNRTQIKKVTGHICDGAFDVYFENSLVQKTSHANAV
jgi:hypothetical protein